MDLREIRDFLRHPWRQHALVLAARHGDVGKLTRLLDGGADLHAQNSLALMTAATHGKTQALALMLARGAVLHDEADRALLLAAGKDDVNTAKILLPHCSNIDKARDAALAEAAKTGAKAMAVFLVEAGAKPDAGLANAVQNGQESVARFLLEQGAKPDKYILWPPVREGFTAIVKLLLEFGADLKDTRNRRTGQTLHEAAREKKFYDIARLLGEEARDPGCHARRYLEAQQALNGQPPQKTPEDAQRERLQALARHQQQMEALLEAVPEIHRKAGITPPRLRPSPITTP